ncbi:hypothetical protein N431DRAFT_223896 [Stipitochalara longipes BDJ]|nr:hypothetical protein N431DRAFT_223896 [Stipitochalara longipes BDJ]
MDTSRATTPSISRQSSTTTPLEDILSCVCILREITAQLSETNEQLRSQCLAYKNSNRCLESSSKFKFNHPGLFNKARHVLRGKDPVRSVEYFIVIRTLFCDAHLELAIFKKYFEQLQLYWKGDGNDEETELLNAIRRTYGLQLPQSPRAAVDPPASCPAPTRIAFGTESTTPRYIGGSQSFGDAVATIGSITEAQSAPPRQGPTAVIPMRPKPSSLLTPSKPPRHTRSRSNPPPQRSRTMHAIQKNQQLRAVFYFKMRQITARNSCGLNSLQDRNYAPRFQPLAL